MDVDFDACLKSFRDSFHQFKSNPTEEHTKKLERELNVLVGITNHGKEKILENFNLQNLLHADVLSIFVSILNDVDLKESIYTSSLGLLGKLASSAKVRKSLQDTFKLTSVLLNVITQHQTPCDQSILLQYLSLLQQVTYGIKIENPIGEFRNLLEYLVSKIISAESILTLPCLGSLANLCRNNVVVQDYIKSMSNVKIFFKSVASFLSHDNWMNIIFALSLLSISLDEPLGEKVFNKKNIDQTFLLIFNVLRKGENCSTRKHSCDLLVDLLKCKRMQQYLASYADLRSHVKELVCILPSADEESCEKILELLLCLQCVPNLLSTIFVKDCAGKKGSDNEEHGGGCLSIILKMAAVQVAQRTRVASLALKLIKIIYQVNTNHFGVSELVPILLQNLHLIEGKYPGNLREKFGTIRRSLELLQILCCEDKTLEFVASFLDAQTIHHFITNIICQFSLEFASEYQSNVDSSLEISSVFIALIELLFMIVRHSKNGEDLYLKTLQSPESSPFLACCLASQSINLVQRSINLIQQATQISNFSADALSVVIAKNNKQIDDKIRVLQKQRVDESSFVLSSDFIIRNEPRKLSQIEKRFSCKDDSSVIAALADRISSGLEIKESAKVSEIMDIYEHKLAAVQVKEKELQDLLDAKTTALTKSDRFIAQYRCRSAQSEAECLKLRSLLLDSQKLSEDQQDQINGYITRLDDLVQKNEMLHEENKILAERSSEFERLRSAYNDQTDRLENLQKDLATAEEGNRDLHSANEVLKNNFKSQLDCSQQKLKEAEQEKQNLLKRLNEKDKKVEELGKYISQVEGKLKEQSNDLHETEKKLKLTETELNFSEEAKLELNYKIEILEKEKKNFLQIVHEFEQLQITHQDYIQRLEATQRSLEVAEKENLSVNEMNAMMKQQGNNLKSKNESLLQHLKELEKEKELLQQVCGEKEMKYEESLKSISNLRQDIKMKETEIKDMGKMAKGIEKQLKQSEKTRADLSHKVSSLSVLNEKYEKEMKDNDILIEDLKSQLEKHSQIAAMIHNLSSGKLPCNALNFSS